MITIRCTRSRGPRGFFCLHVFRRGPVNVDVIPLNQQVTLKRKQNLATFPNRHLQYRLERLENKLDLILQHLGIAEKETELDVMLLSFKDRKLDVCKAVRTIRNCSLMEAKRLIDTLPAAIVSGVNKNEADLVCRELTTFGALVELRPSPLDKPETHD